MDRNRLLAHKAYLIGPIDRCPNGGKDWRTRITPKLNKIGVVVLDPLKKPMDFGGETDDYRKEREIWKKTEDFEELSSIMKTVRTIDLAFVDRMDFGIVYLDMDVPMCGTMEEIFWGNREKKPTIIWCPQGKKKVPDWLFGTLPHELFFETEEEVLAYLNHIDKDKAIDTLGRWKFFDPAKLYTCEILAKINERILINLK